MSPNFPRPRISYSSPTAAFEPLGIVEADGLKPLLRLLQSPDLNLISAAVSCVRNVTLRSEHDSPIIEAGFLQPLVNLMAFKDSEMIQCDAAEALGNLAESTEKNKLAIVDAGAVQSIKELIVESPPLVQVAMARCIRGLSLSGMHPPFNCLLQSHPPLDDIKGRFLMGISELLTSEVPIRLPHPYRYTKYEHRGGPTSYSTELFSPL